LIRASVKIPTPADTRSDKQAASISVSCRGGSVFVLRFALIQIFIFVALAKGAGNREEEDYCHQFRENHGGRSREKERGTGKSRKGENLERGAKHTGSRKTEEQEHRTSRRAATGDGTIMDRDETGTGGTASGRDGAERHQRRRSSQEADKNIKIIVHQCPEPV
jgi:hypothetical protein